jgi:hypothetical protein
MYGPLAALLQRAATPAALSAARLAAAVGGGLPSQANRRRIERHRHLFAMLSVRSGHYCHQLNRMEVVKGDTGCYVAAP